MASSNDIFKDVNFLKEDWTEEEWAAFFRAQDAWVREKEKSLRGRRVSLFPENGNSFRRVLRHFGMDPDGPAGIPSAHVGGPLDESKVEEEFWKEGVGLESLPVYIRARGFALRLQYLADRRFPKIFAKTFKSRSHIMFQTALRELIFNASDIPRYLAAGHGLGYESHSVKGNIVHCRTALTRADASLGLITRFFKKRLPYMDYRRLFGDALVLRNDVMGWVALLRDRFVPVRDEK